MQRYLRVRLQAYTTNQNYKTRGAVQDPATNFYSDTRTSNAREPDARHRRDPPPLTQDFPCGTFQPG